MNSARPQTNSLNKKDLDALGKVFAAEINNNLPFQSRSKIYNVLCDAGLLETTNRRMGVVTIYGYQLTHAGRFAYCSSCKEPT